MIQTIQFFFQQSIMPQEWNQTFFTLVLKKGNLVQVHNYLPISICNTLYKIIARIIVNRLQPLLPSMVSMELEAFVQGRGIVQNILLAQEVMYSFTKTLPTRGLSWSRLTYEKYITIFIGPFYSSSSINLAFTPNSSLGSRHLFSMLSLYYLLMVHQ